MHTPAPQKVSGDEAEKPWLRVFQKPVVDHSQPLVCTRLPQHDRFPNNQQGTTGSSNLLTQDPLKGTKIKILRKNSLFPNLISLSSLLPDEQSHLGITLVDQIRKSKMGTTLCRPGHCHQVTPTHPWELHPEAESSSTPDTLGSPPSEPCLWAVRASQAELQQSGLASWLTDFYHLMSSSQG